MTRSAWFVLPGHPLTCADGHVIRQEWQLTEDGFPRCAHHAKGGAECGRRVYALVFPRRVKGRPLILLADVTGPEIRALLEATADVDEILTALGLTWSPSDAKRGVPPPTIAAVR